MIKILNARIVILLAVALAGMLSFASYAHANPFYTAPKAVTATATSTQAYMTPGTATTTPIYDSYEQYGTNQVNSGNITIPNTVAVVLDGRASSTATTLNVACEFSDNYNGTTGNGDWYQNEIYPATTTGTQLITVPLSFGFTYASSTVGGAGLSGSNNRFQKLVTCPVPLRYVRAVITVTGANASIWSAIIPTKQRN